MPTHHSFAHADAKRRRGIPADHASATGQPMQTSDIERLAAWFSGDIAITRSQAHRLLDSAAESGDIARYRAEFVTAVKALAVGPRHWHEMGYRLLPDD